MKRYLWILSGIFTLGIAVTIAFRMTSDAMAVIVGIILGMLATLPTSLILLYLFKQQQSHQIDPRQQYQAGQYPPVVVVNSPPGGAGYGMGNANPHPFLPAISNERSFKVVGQEASPTEAKEGISLSSIWDDN